MSGFKETVEADNSVFLDTDTFGEMYTIVYDGTTYADVPAILTKIKESERNQLVTDHAQGLYLVSATLHCKKDDLGGNLPERGMKIKVSDEGYLRRYTVASSSCVMGMLRVELEAIDE